MKKVLVLGHDNACRSQMIAALMKHVSFNRIDVTSAGVKPKKIDVTTLKVLQEIGVNIEQEKSRSVNEFIHTNFDIIFRHQCVSREIERRFTSNILINPKNIFGNIENKLSKHPP